MHKPLPGSSSSDSARAVIDDGRHDQARTLTLEEIQALLNKAAQDKFADVLLDMDSRDTV